MNWSNWQWIITIILIPFFQWLWSLKKEKRNELKEIVELLKEDNKYLKGEVADCRKRDEERDRILYENMDTIEEMKRQIKKLQNDIK